MHVVHLMCRCFPWQLFSFYHQAKIHSGPLTRKFKQRKTIQQRTLFVEASKKQRINVLLLALDNGSTAKALQLLPNKSASLLENTWQEAGCLCGCSWVCMLRCIQISHTRCERTTHTAPCAHLSGTQRKHNRAETPLELATKLRPCK